MWRTTKMKPNGNIKKERQRSKRQQIIIIYELADNACYTHTITNTVTVAIVTERQESASIYP